MMTIEAVDPAQEADSLGEILHACVHGGASVNFVLPFSREEAAAYWRTVTGRTVLLAREDGRALGTVSLDPARQPNQPHRAEVAKMLVHPDGRGRGIAKALMLRLEDFAREDGRTLLTLDTETGSAGEHLYASLGYIRVGTFPDFALDAKGERFVSSTFYYKQLVER